MTQTQLDLAGIFQAVTRTLAENEKNLDHADTINQDHGRNMVQTFQTITGALQQQQKKGSTDGAALEYAAKALSQKAASGSAQQYAQNLSKAAGQFKGKKIDEQSALQLLQTLIGSQAGQPAAGDASDGSDVLGTLLGSLTGDEASSQGSMPGEGSELLGSLLGGLAGGATSSSGSSETGSSELLGSLLGSLTGAESGDSGKQDGIQLQNVLAAGMAYLQARQSGKGNLDALAQAFVAGSNMGNSTHRTQSTQLVAQAFLQALSSAAGRS